MKILSQGKEVYIVSVSKKEMARLLGFYSESPTIDLKEGMLVDINGLYDHLYTHKSLLKELKESAKKLRYFADIIEYIPVPIKEISDVN